jgi:uncharacterized RDD family membrane protein YckC
MIYLKARERQGHPMPSTMNFDLRPGNVKIVSNDPEFNEQMHHELLHIVSDIAIPVLYFGLLTWKDKGRSPGKRLLRIRVVSIVHRHLSLWHSVERALGYGAAALEGGFGFVQFFIHPYRRCVQDRIAETIVVTERSYKLLQSTTLHPLLPDEAPQPETGTPDETKPAELPPPTRPALVPAEEVTRQPTPSFPDPTA